nr:hypothetical protein GCM10020093_058220 [Planobispora longispora]
MYFTDRGIEELVTRRGEEEVTMTWLAERLREFVDLNPEFETPWSGWPPGWPGWTTRTSSPRAARGAGRTAPAGMSRHDIS